MGKNFNKKIQMKKVIKIFKLLNIGENNFEVAFTRSEPDPFFYTDPRIPASNKMDPKPCL